MPAKQVDTDSGTAVTEKSFATQFEPPNNVIESLTASFFQLLERLSFGLWQVNAAHISVLLAGSEYPPEVRTREFSPRPSAKVPRKRRKT